MSFNPHRTPLQTRKLANTKSTAPYDAFKKQLNAVANVCSITLAPAANPIAHEENLGATPRMTRLFIYKMTTAAATSSP